MKVHAYNSTARMGAYAAQDAARSIRAAIDKHGMARVMFAAAPSQNEMLHRLCPLIVNYQQKIWACHMDEWCGLRSNHPAAFRNYLRQRLCGLLPNLLHFEEIRGDDDPQREIARLNALFSGFRMDVICGGIGMMPSPHLAFNDSPADMVTRAPFILVRPPKGCREQQVFDKCFPTVDEVPITAITASMYYMLDSDAFIATVPGEHKGSAVLATLENQLDPTPDVPASYLGPHKGAKLFLDPGSSKLARAAGFVR